MGVETTDANSVIFPTDPECKFPMFTRTIGRRKMELHIDYIFSFFFLTLQNITVGSYVSKYLHKQRKIALWVVGKTPN